MMLMKVVFYGVKIVSKVSSYRLVFYMFFHGRGADLDTVPFQLISVKDIIFFILFCILCEAVQCMDHIDLHLERMLEFFKETYTSQYDSLQFLKSTLSSVIYCVRDPGFVARPKRYPVLD